MARRPSLRRSAPRKLTKPDSLSGRIYAELRERLQHGAIGPDDRLVDTEIAAAYGTSRMPVREALLRLANEGYLVGTTRGFTLPKLSLEDVRDIFEVRRLLEPKAAANAARDLDDAGLRELGRAIEEARRAVQQDDVDGLILANSRFRAAWLGAVRNDRLASTIGRFVDHVQTVRLGTLTDRPTREIVLNGLEQLHDAFARRDPAAAAERMAAFMEAAERAFLAAREAELAPTPEPRRAAQGGAG